MPNSEPLLIAGRYRLVRALASGGMGVVWKGWDERLQRTVAIKQLRVQPGLRPSEAATARDRALREGRNTARLHHPHAVPVYDVVEQDGEPCLVMEFLPSVSLHEAIRQRGTLPLAEVARIGSEVAAALAAAHQAGIVHRDVKPGNVLLAHDGTTKLTDFGISHAVGDTTLTAVGMLSGTPAYLAPEVARGQPANFASDVFSLGATLYAAIEGAPPFGEDDNAMAVLHRVASGEILAPLHAGALTPLLIRMLAIDPQHRPGMTEVSRTLAAPPSGAEPAGAVHQQAGVLGTTRLDRQQSEPVPGLPAPPTLAEFRPAPAPAPPAPARSHRRRAVIAALLAGAVAIAAAVAIVLNWPAGSSGGGHPTAAAVGAKSPTQSAGRAPASTRRARASSGSSRQTPAGSAATPSSTPAGQPAAATPDAAQLAQAITDYYALMPDNLRQGWALLTPSYQRRTAGGFAGYQRFWSRFRRVTASDASGRAPDSAQAVITYVDKHGHRAVERTGYELVMSGGQLKINASTLL